MPIHLRILGWFLHWLMRGQHWNQRWHVWLDVTLETGDPEEYANRLKTTGVVSNTLGEPRG